MAGSPAFSILILISTVILFLCPTVRSDSSNPLRLPSTDNNNDHLYAFDSNDRGLCAGTVSASPNACPVKCFRTEPVCGADGVTYWCGCADALCAGIRVVKLGFCAVDNAGSGPVSGQAFLLIHMVWLLLLAVFLLFGLF